MNWTEQSQLIAESLIESVEHEDCTREELLACLAKAAFRGMEFECDNWLFKRR